MSSIFDILESLKNTTSRLEKEQILADNNSTFFKSIVKAALDPHTTYHIKKIPEYTTVESDHISLGHAMDILLDQLSRRHITGNAARDLLADVLSNLRTDDAEVLARIILKDLKCGVSIATANKVFGKDFISKFPCMLASKHDEKSISNIQFPAILQEKMDGMRIAITVDCNRQKVKYQSRNGKTVYCNSPMLDGLILEVAILAANYYKTDSVTLDGELLAADERGRLLNRKTSNGIANKAIQGTISPEELNMLYIMVWDVIPTKAFQTGKFENPYEERFSHEVFLGINRVEKIKSIVVNDWNEAQQWANHFMALGGEGAIVKNSNHIWQDKRSKDLVKLKAEINGDFVVTNWNEGTGKYKGKLGALECETSDGKLKFNVGTGFSDEMRDAYDSDYMIGKIITVKYNEIIEDKSSDTKSLFLPVFLEIRHDKDIANSLDEL